VNRDLLDARDTVRVVHDRGAHVIPGFLTDEALVGLRAASMALLESEHALEFPKSTRVWDLYRHGSEFCRLLTLPRLADLITELLGEHYLLSDFSLNVVNPQQPRDDWHLDYPFNEMPTLVHGSLLGLQCVLMLDDFNAENGATQFIEGSHKPPARPDASGSGDYETAQAEAGSLLVMAASTWHRSGFNTSAASRGAILLSFVERWVRPMTDPPEPGPWATTERQRIMLGLQRPPETLNGVPIEGAGRS
jgi:ectoine hydroxylase-related dioxygenase (phytanoyl-CoA dioxygenase family)